MTGMMGRQRLNELRRLRDKPGPILAGEARAAICELIAEVERCWGGLQIGRDGMELIGELDALANRMKRPEPRLYE